VIPDLIKWQQSSLPGITDFFVDYLVIKSCSHTRKSTAELTIFMAQIVKNRDHILLRAEFLSLQWKMVAANE